MDKYDVIDSSVARITEAEKSLQTNNDPVACDALVQVIEELKEEINFILQWETIH